MPTRLDVLKNPQQVWHRSSTRYEKLEATIVLDDRQGNCIQVQFPKSETASYQILIDTIQSVKVKDFQDASGPERSFIYTLSVNYAPAGKDISHSSFQFSKQDVRNAWDHGLRSLLSGAVQSAKGSEVKVPSAKYKEIKQITLQKPKGGELVRIHVDLGDAQADLVITREKASSDNCKTEATSFIDKNNILPTETTSLYRYMRSVVQRAQMEEEVSKIVKQINDQSLEEVQKRNPGRPLNEMLNETKVQLENIARDVPQNVGQHGSGAAIVTQVLKRNVEKMKLINEMFCRLQESEGGAANGH